MKKALDCKYPGVTFQKTCLGMGPKFIHIVRPGCDIFIRAVMNRVECVYLPFRMFFISLRVISYARNIISAQAGVNLTFVMHVQCSMNAFIRLEYLKLLWGLFFCFPSLFLSLSLSLCNMSERLHPPLIWDAGQIRGPFIVYFTLELFWSRWRQGAAFFPFPFLSLSFFISSAARVSFACIVFEQCSVWTVRSQLRIQARSTDRLLSPAFPSDSINASVSLKKGGRGQQTGALAKRQTRVTSNKVSREIATALRQPFIRGDWQSRAGWGILCVCVCACVCTCEVLNH